MNFQLLQNWGTKFHGIQRKYQNSVPKEKFHGLARHSTACRTLWALVIGSDLLTTRLTEPQLKLNLVHYKVKMWDLVATILIIFLSINWPT